MTEYKFQGVGSKVVLGGEAVDGSSDKLRRAAWIGDAVLKLDVRIALLSMADVGSKDLEYSEQTFVSNAALARYWKSARTNALLWQPRGDSEHSLGTAFEANYFGQFRRDFLIVTFGSAVCDRVCSSWTEPVVVSR